MLETKKVDTYSNISKGKGWRAGTVLLRKKKVL